ncbi:hypothetical protein GDO81_029132 [Engystomops pustulosus]|uniref:Uncharacterized protein n=1 Tax=Engystomops pustulosus TaxID=76066 RepID=A0AAV6YJT3_ENGPU|nr:hypothetical protein GDO81_029132 [Engystomops pustulosus]
MIISLYGEHHKKKKSKKTSRELMLFYSCSQKEVPKFSTIGDTNPKMVTLEKASHPAKKMPSHGPNSAKAKILQPSKEANEESKILAAAGRSFPSAPHCVPIKQVTATCGGSLHSGEIVEQIVWWVLYFYLLEMCKF